MTEEKKMLETDEKRSDLLNVSTEAQIALENRRNFAARNTPVNMYNIEHYCCRIKMYDTQDIETLRSAIYEGNNNFLGYYIK